MVQLKEAYSYNQCVVKASQSFCPILPHGCSSHTCPPFETYFNSQKHCKEAIQGVTGTYISQNIPPPPPPPTQTPICLHKTLFPLTRDVRSYVHKRTKLIVHDQTAYAQCALSYSMFTNVGVCFTADEQKINTTKVWRTNTICLISTSHLTERV